MENKKHRFPWFRVTVMVIISLCCVSIYAFKAGYIGKVSDSKIKKYSSINEMLNETNRNIIIPNFLLNETNVMVKDTMGMVVEIGNDRLVLKIANYVADEADILGLYEKCEVDNFYEVETGPYGITSIRYRTGHPDYKNCTLVNWHSEHNTYGLMLADIYTEDQVLEMFTISKDMISSKSKDNTANTIEESSKILMYTYNYDNVTFELPVKDNEAAVNIIGNEVNISLDATLCLIITDTYSDDKYNSIEDIEFVKRKDGVCIYYRKNNPFDTGSDSYINYNKIILTIDDITSSISYQN